jgi:peptidoglycan/LPS O-acetylase OafA/YrhL
VRSSIQARSGPRTLADAFGTGADNFLLLRFVAASMVVYAHGYPLSGMDKTDIFVRAGFGADAGNIAVCIFFCISGFLVTGSLSRWPSVVAFLKSRILRLFPAFAVCLALCALVIGPLLTTLPTEEYFRHESVRVYVIDNLSLMSVHFVLPGVTFGNGATRNVVNGSIWTLPGEGSMYLWLAGLALAGVFRRNWFATAFLLIAIPVGARYWSDIPMLVDDDRYLPFACMFVLGSLCYLQRRHIPLGHGWMLGFLVLAWAVHGGILHAYVFPIVETYFCFWFAYCLPWHGFNRFGDYSYGVYLWGYPCEQIIVRWLDHPRPLQIAMLAFPMALALAIASWHLIERPALKLKKIRLLANLGIFRAAAQQRSHS